MPFLGGYVSSLEGIHIHSVDIYGREPNLTDPWKINILHIIPWRFGSDDFSFQKMVDGCRFHVDVSKNSGFPPKSSIKK